jgi:twitching motility two-component system response regulator PilG
LRALPHDFSGAALKPAPDATLLRANWTYQVTATDLSGFKVLVIDDSTTIRRSAQIFLGQAKCEVIVAEDGFGALAKVVEHDPDIIFLDVMMPRLDGYQTCALIKRNPRFGEIPVVMLSSKDGLFDRARGHLAGADEYLTKPFTRESLLGAVETLARRRART